MESDDYLGMPIKAFRLQTDIARNGISHQSFLFRTSEKI